MAMPVVLRYTAIRCMLMDGAEPVDFHTVCHWGMQRRIIFSGRVRHEEKKKKGCDSGGGGFKGCEQAQHVT